MPPDNLGQNIFPVVQSSTLSDPTGFGVYSSYFGFAESPFENNLDQRFLYLSNDHREVLESLLYFIKARKAIATVCGDAGTGKTLLINSLSGHLHKSVKLIIINNPHVTFLDILLCLAKSLRIKSAYNENILQLINKIKDTLIKRYREDKYYVLIIDEAHLFSIQSLQDIRLLSNIEIPEGKLLQVIFFGQYEFSSKLNQPEMRALRQRININRVISPLNQRETLEYINHRLTKVGSSFEGCFEPNCRKFIYDQTGGVPRQINQLCDTAFIIGMAEDRKKINLGILKDAAKAVKTDVSLTVKAMDQKKPYLLPAMGLILALGVLILGGLLDRTFSWNMKALHGLYELWPRTSMASKLKIAPAHETPEEPTVVSIINKKEPLKSEDVKETQSSSAQDIGPNSTLPTQLVVEKGDNLSKIAKQYYSEDPKFGLIAISLANPKIAEDDRIVIGKPVFLPKVDFNNKTIQSQDNLLYIFYGLYYSKKSFIKHSSWLRKKNIRFITRHSKGPGGNNLYRVFIGGYKTEKELMEAVSQKETD